MTHWTEEPPGEGLYERLWTRALARLLRDDPGAIRDDLDTADSPRVLALHLYTLLHRLLPLCRGDDALAQRVRIHSTVVEALRTSARELGLDLDAALDEIIDGDPQLLRAIVRTRTPLGELASPPPRPGIPLDASALLVHARDEFRLGVELQRELASADRVLLVCAFLKWSGYRLIVDALRELRSRGKSLRVLTTVYLGSTQMRVLDHLTELGADVRVSLDTRRTRLHAKAWLFERDSGYSTAYVGSSNLSKDALLDGLEWNVRLSRIETPRVLDQFRAAFESYWEDPEFEDLAAPGARGRIQSALDDARAPSAADTEPVLSGLELRPYAFQQEILERLEAERLDHGRWRNLVVAATGTGKTVIAALDYRRLPGLLANKPGAPLPSLLFIAHRDEILRQSRRVFREALADPAFGELLTGDEKPTRGTHVFASIQTLHRRDPAQIAPEAFEVVIVDEFHHAEAPSYRRWLAHLHPRVLLGLTATPERADGVRVQDEFFDGHLATELRLWDAIDRGLLSPFHWFGIHDGTDLREVTWRRGNYDLKELERIYTADEIRVRLILQQVAERVPDPQRMRALCFCVSVEHARFMAERFDSAGLKARAVTGETPAEERRASLRDLARGSIQLVCTVDLFNEGVDLPTVDTLLMLRPTHSAMLFQQQLGRGLRLTPGKDCCTVLDFIGNVRREFRFDRKLGPLLGLGRLSVLRAVEEGFPRLPAGCSMQLDRVARETVLENLREALRNTRRELQVELSRLGPDASLATFLAETGRELEDVYRKSGESWCALRRSCGFSGVTEQDEEQARSFYRLLTVDDDLRLGTWRQAIASATPPALVGLSPSQRRTFDMLAGNLGDSRGEQPDAADALASFWSHVGARSEMAALLDLVAARRDHLDRAFTARPDVPLRLHARYALHEVAAAFGMSPQVLRSKGVHHDRAHSCDLLFVTLDKSEREYSPTTMYQDYAISAELFHWETQSTTPARSNTAARYLATRLSDTSHCILLFVRKRKSLRPGVTAPYVFLGPVEAVRHEGSRPVRIVWRLGVSMPASVLREARLAAG
jgi:superfamily II DNA or RNA helicase/HKD family nuclease